MKLSAINGNYNLALKSKVEFATSENNLKEGKVSKKTFSPALMGMGILAVAGISYGIYKHNDAKKISALLDETKKALDETMKKLNTQEEKVSIVEKALKAANEKIKELMTKLSK